MISLLINTHGRYDNLLKILSTQCEYKIISEVLVFNNGGKEIPFSNRKLKVISANYDVGLRSRWILGALATKSCLFVQDDDLLVSECVFDIIHGHYLFDYDKLYGIFGRRIDAAGEYSLSQAFLGDVDLILTRLACFDKALIPYLLEGESRIIEPQKRWPTAKEFPHDDILLSYVATSVFNKKPFAVKVDDLPKFMVELDENDGLHRAEDYMSNRKKIIDICRRTFLNEEIQYPIKVTD